MTDSNATELCKLLDELGVKYEARDIVTGLAVVWDGHACKWIALDDEPGLAVAVYKDYLTPEQAVAATLGSGCTYGQWRAISEAISDAMEYAHDKAIEYPDKADPLWNLDEYVDRVIEAEFGTATLGAGECELSGFADVKFNVEYEVEGYDMDSGTDYATLAECSSCGAFVIVPPAHHHVLTCDGSEVFSEYTCCPVCRKAVKHK